MTPTRAYLSFAAFGAFWGTWGAAIPRVRAQTGVDDARLGLALLFVAAGALPAMLLTGRVLDRHGLRGPALALPLLGLTGLGLAVLARDAATLCVVLALVGAASGAGDVAVNTVAGRAEQATGRPVIFRSHGVFSVAVVVSSLATGLTGRVGAPLWVAFGVVAIACAVGGAAVYGGGAGGSVSGGGAAGGGAAGVRGAEAGPAGAGAPTRAAVGPGVRSVGLLLIGAVAALGFAVENAHQSWGAIFLEDVTGASVGTSALAPASFAATVALTRFLVAEVPPAWATRVLLLGGGGSVAGSVLLATSTSLVTALAGLALAAAGTAVLLPTLLGIVARTVPDARRGRAVSRVTTTAYLGFLLGPVYVGALTDAADLRVAMVGVAALGVLVVALVPLVPGRQGPREVGASSPPAGRYGRIATWTERR